jgi:hypothetical protein
MLKYDAETAPMVMPAPDDPMHFKTVPRVPYVFDTASPMMVNPFCVTAPRVTESDVNKYLPPGM